MENSYTVKQVSEMLKTNPETVRRWIRDGKLVAEKSSNKSGNIILGSSLNSFVKTMPKYSGILAASLPITLISAAAVVAGSVAYDKLIENKSLDGSKIDVDSIKVLLESQILSQKNDIEKKLRAIEKLQVEISNSEKIIDKLNNLLINLENKEK